MDDICETDDTHTSYCLPPKLYHICEPWSDTNSLASTSAQNTPRFGNTDSSLKAVNSSSKLEPIRKEEDRESGVGLDADSGDPTDKESSVVPRFSSSHSSVDNRDDIHKFHNKPPVSSSSDKTDMIVGNVERLLSQVGDLISSSSTYSAVKPIDDYVYIKINEDSNEIKEKSDYEEKEESQEILTERTDVTEYQELPHSTNRENSESLAAMYQRNSKLLESGASSAQSSARDVMRTSFRALEEYRQQHPDAIFSNDKENRVADLRSRLDDPFGIPTERSYNMKSADQEVEYFSRKAERSTGSNSQNQDSIPDAIDTNQSNTFSDWARRTKVFNYEAVKRDLADIESRLKATRVEWPSQSVKGIHSRVNDLDNHHKSFEMLEDTGQTRKSQSMLDIQMHRSHCHSDGSGGSPDPPNQSKAHSFTSIPFNSANTRGSRLKWDYAADIALAKTTEMLTIQAETLGVADEISSKSDGALPGMKMSLSQGSFVSSPDIEDCSHHRHRFGSLRAEDSRTVERVLAKVEMTERELKEAVWGDKQGYKDSQDGYYSGTSSRSRSRSPHSPYYPDEDFHNESPVNKGYTPTDYDEDVTEDQPMISDRNQNSIEHVIPRDSPCWDQKDKSAWDKNSWRRLDLGSRNPSFDSGEREVLSDGSDNSQLESAAKPKQPARVKSVSDHPDESGQSNRSNENTNRSTTTMESTHLGSDDACPPKDLPENAFGSRHDPPRSGYLVEQQSFGIYSRTSSLMSTQRVTGLPPRPTVSGQPHHHLPHHLQRGGVHQPPPSTNHLPNDDGLVGYHWRHSPLETISSKDTWEEENTKEEVRRSFNASSPDSEADKENRQEYYSTELTRSEMISDLQEKWDRYRRIQDRDYSGLKSNFLISSQRRYEPLYPRQEDETFDGAHDSRYPLHYYSNNHSSGGERGAHPSERVSHEEKRISPSHKLRSNQKWTECRQTANSGSRTDKYAANQEWTRGQGGISSTHVLVASGGENNTSGNQTRGSQTNGGSKPMERSSYFPAENRQSNSSLSGGWRRLGGGDDSSDDERRRPRNSNSNRNYVEYHSDSEEETLSEQDQDPNQIVTSLTLTDDVTSSVETEQLAARMKRIAAQERKHKEGKYTENSGDRVRPRLLNKARDESQPYDEELLKLKQLVLRHREKLLQEKIKEDRRKRKINLLQDLIKEKERGNSIEIYSALETDTASVISQSSSVDWFQNDRKDFSGTRKPPRTPPATPDNQEPISQPNSQFFEIQFDKTPTKKRKHRRIRRSKSGNRPKRGDDYYPSDNKENEESMRFQITEEDVSQLSLDDEQQQASSRKMRHPKVYRNKSPMEGQHLKVAPPVSTAPFCAQVYPPSQSWVIPAPDLKKPPRRRSRSNSPTKKENDRINRSRILKQSPPRSKYVSDFGSHNKWEDVDPKVSRNEVDEEFVESARSMEERHGEAKAAGGGLSWYLPVDSKDYFKESLTSTGDRSRKVYREPSLGMEIVGIDPPASMPPEAHPSYEETLDDIVKRHGKMVCDETVDLQTAFIQKKADFISRSRERQRRVQLAAAERKYISKVDAERTRLFTGSEAGGGVARRVAYPDPLVVRSSSISPPRNKSKSLNRSKSLFEPKKRRFTNRQMRRSSARAYKTLPEVKQRQADEARSIEQRDNRYRMKAYGEKILRSVLRKRAPWVTSFS